VPVARASEVIAFLNARAGSRGPIERSTRMPYGWALWLRSLPPLPPRPQARASQIAAELAAQPPRRRPPGERLGRLGALLALLRQGWEPAPRDERPLRLSAQLGSLLLHLAFVAFLSWLAVLQALPPPQQAAGGGGERIGIGFVGRGDPQAGGEGGEAGAEQGAAAAATPARDARAQGAPPLAGSAAQDEAADQDQDLPLPPVPSLPLPVAEPRPQLAPSIPELAEREVAEPLPPVEQEQPVQVTEVEQPTIDYVLPPTTPPQPRLRELAQPQLRPREVEVGQVPRLQVRTPELATVAPRSREPQLRAREVEVVEARPLPVPATRELATASPRLREVQLRQREVDEPLPALELPVPGVRAPEARLRQPQAQPAPVRERELATPVIAGAAPAPAASAATPASASAASGAAPSSAANATGRAPAAGSVAARPAAPGTAAPPGAADAADPWGRALAGDDWSRPGPGGRQAGSESGLFDGQGRVRLPGLGEGTGHGPGNGPLAGSEGGQGERGAPGSDNDRWTEERFARSGTWMRRPPSDYQATRFDRYWVPNESLLAEWVRKGIKSVAIPIPGSGGKKLNCVVSLLQLGGGCGISDDNLNVNPAEARPPPDIPFKPELQEENGSVPAG